MKILHINTNYTGSTLHKAMIDRLQKYCENRVFVPTHDKSRSLVPIDQEVLVSQCFRKWDRVLFLYKQKKILRALEGAYDIGQFDLLHAYTLFTDGNAAYELHKKYGVPYVVAVRNTDVNTFFKYRPHLRGRGVKILRNAAAVFFLSASYEKQVMGQYVPQRYRKEIQDKTYRIPNGIDPYWFTRGQAHKKPEGNRLRMVFAGNIDRNKNIVTAARGCGLLRDKGMDATLTVIGKVVDEGVAQELSQIPYVEVCSRMTKEELAAVYEEKDMFIMVSKCESFGLVYAEAMSQGLPVIYSKGQGFDGQFPEGTVGYGVPSTEPQEILHAVEEILQEYEAMSLRCVENSKVFQWETFVSRYYEIYKECLG